MRGLTLDAGSLIAFERADEDLLACLDLAARDGRAIHVLPDVLAQAWRGDPRSARLARLLGTPTVSVPPYGTATAKAVGEALAASGTRDAVDAHVAVHARAHKHHIVTSDPDDIRRIDPAAVLIRI